MQRSQQTNPPPPTKVSNLQQFLTTGPLQLLFALIVPVLGFFMLWRSFVFMRDADAPRSLIAVVALLVGVFGVWFLFWATNALVERFPARVRDGLRPYVFVGPAMTILGVYLVYPALNTLMRSFMNRNSTEFVGLENYRAIFFSREIQQVLLNNFMWLVFVTAGAVIAGLLIAVLVDRIGRLEPVAKSFIFLPMAISAVGASVIWKFMYDKQTTPGLPEIGFVNAVITSLGGRGLDFIRSFPINNFAFMFIMFWMVTGFCMVILSAAIKGVPSELLEAARIDGASEIRTFFSVTVPYIGPTLLVVTTTVLIMVLKVFDIVYVFGGQLYGADVIANRMFRELFTFVNYGLGSALASLLLIAVLPIIFWNIRELRQAQGR
ncbi:MAG: ABC transporter permease subunit [Deinococcota bacterium]|nr:ABC transporter permease subunit [Deinococcota bacterium]